MYSVASSLHSFQQSNRISSERFIRGWCGFRSYRRLKRQFHEQIAMQYER
nr:MAG TPA: hypothetical protein [Bacteriophage sp.]